MFCFKWAQTIFSVDLELMTTVQPHRYKEGEILPGHLHLNKKVVNNKYWISYFDVEQCLGQNFEIPAMYFHQTTKFAFPNFFLIFFSLSSWKKIYWSKQIFFFSVLDQWIVLWQFCAPMMGWVGCLLPYSVIPDEWKLKEWE